MTNNQTRNNAYSNRDNPYQGQYTHDPVRDEYIRQTERTRANNEAAWSTLIGIGIATLLALGIGSLVWPSLFKANDPQAPTVGPEQTKSNTPANPNESRTQQPERNTVIIERNRTQVLPVPVETPQSPSPQPTPSVNITTPPASPTPNVNVTVPPTTPNTNGTLLDTNPRPTSDPSVQPPRASDNQGTENTQPSTPTEQPQSYLNSPSPGELVSVAPSDTGNSSGLFNGRRE